MKIDRGDYRYIVTTGSWANGEYAYDVQCLTKAPGGYVYAGYGRYCRDLNEVHAYIDSAAQ